MGALVLISGPNGSGKSAFAEDAVCLRAGPRYYIATMRPCTPENRGRVAAHRRRRAGRGFHTLEIPLRIEAAPVAADASVLLEDVSNLLANAVFDAGETAEAVFARIAALRARCGWLAAVTISGLDEAAYEGETAAYIRELCWLNDRLLAAADAAFTMEDGIPRPVKGAACGMD